MGLPLFVASVESDLPSKAADKAGGATSPSRSGIRRHGRTDSRERRAAMRRHMSIRDRLANGPLRQSSSSSTRIPQSQFQILNQTYIGPDGIERARPVREILREVARSDDRNRERFEEQLHSLFTGTPLRERDAINNDLEQSSLGWFSVDSIPPSTRTRIAGSSNSRPDGVDSRPRSRQRSSPLVQQPVIPRISLETDTTSQRRRLRREPLNLRSMSELEGDEDRRSATLQRIRDVNGLGDRERSLSPEVWDTLLTTLTPDPQPPSVGSSFASTVASQSAGVSSGTALTTPEAGGVTTTDQACESGCENSDTEDFDSEMDPALRRTRRLRQEERERRRVRMRVPDYNLDGLVDMDREGPTPLSGLSSSGLPVTGLTPELFGRSNSLSSEMPRIRRLGIVTSAARMETREREESMDSTVGSGNLTLSQLRGSRHGWVGHLSVGTSDDEQGTERRSLNRESSTLSGNLTSQGEEDWAGMLHIVRGLARREDIPDEWWAEAGLSRTLP